MRERQDNPSQPYPNIAIGRFSDLGDRFDGGFHVARIHMRDRVAELEASIHPQEAIRRLRALPSHALAGMHVLTRGTQVRGGPSPHQIDRAIVAYPHLALALVEPAMQVTADRIRAEIEKCSEMLSVIQDLTAPQSGLGALADTTTQGEDVAETQEQIMMATTREGIAYPLNVPDRFDDEEFGTGYGYVMVPTGDGEADYWMRDMWVVNEKGEVHPGYDASPVPIRMEDIDVAAGIEIVPDLPARHANLGSSFGRR